MQVSYVFMGVTMILSAKLKQVIMLQTDRCILARSIKKIGELVRSSMGELARGVDRCSKSGS